MKIEKDLPIVCFGEVLWDIFPEGKQLGGAPLNVAYHLTQFGYTPIMISKIGSDELGKELIGIMQERGLSSSSIQKSEKYPTGVVKVKVAESGDASYDIVFPSAWDFIDTKSEWNLNSYALVFGSLASRHDQSRKTLLKLLDKSSFSIFDVNFRAPHYSQSLIEELMAQATIVKLNDDELEIMKGWYGIESDLTEDVCASIQEQFNLDQIIVTLGSNGALVYKNGESYKHAGFKVNVANTVGSGDSFLAAYLAYYLRGSTIQECLQMACATGAFVATREGAVPKYQMDDIRKLVSL